MTEEQIKAGVSQFLEEAGFVVTAIPESDQETPDLLVTGDHRYAIEVKAREDDPAAVEEFEKAVASGGVGEFGTPFVPHKRVSEIIRKGVSQLRSLDPSERDFSLLWLVATGKDQTGQYEQFRHTLYGLANVTGPDSNRLTPCYYFRHSAFFRWRNDLDGAIITTEAEGQFLLNSYSPRSADLALSDLAKRFGGAMISPLDLEARELAYIADCEIDRKDENAMLSYVASKYGRPALMTFNLGTHAFYVEVSDHDE